MVFSVGQFLYPFFLFECYPSLPIFGPTSTPYVPCFAQFQNVSTLKVRGNVRGQDLQFKFVFGWFSPLFQTKWIVSTSLPKKVDCLPLKFYFIGYT